MSGDAQEPIVAEFVVDVRQPSEVAVALYVQDALTWEKTFDDVDAALQSLRDRVRNLIAQHQPEAQHTRGDDP